MHLPAYTTTHPSPTSVQITALLLSLAPLWSLSVALYRWPQTRRRLERRRRRSAALSLSLSTSLPVSLTHAQTTTGSVTDLIVPNPDFIPHADPLEDGTGKGKEKGDATVEHIETTHTRTTALPAGERARPTRARALQSAMRGGRARSREQDGRSRSHSHSHSQSDSHSQSHSQSQSQARSRPRPYGPRAAHTRGPTGYLLDAVAVPMSTAEEWNELATFGRGSSPGS